MTASPGAGVNGTPNKLDFVGSPAVGGVGSITCSITVDAVPLGGTTVQVGTDHPSVIISPSGSWPYGLVYVGGGSNVASFVITTQGVSADTQITVYACESGVDISNPANWRVTGTITVTHV